MNLNLVLTSLVLFVGGTLHAQYASDEWAERDTWMNVPKIFELAGIKKGSKVADVGCHEGYLSFHLSKQVGEDGKVYSVDVEEYRLDDFKEHMQERNATNIEVILGDYDNPKLPEGVLDVVILMDTYHEIEYYMKMLSQIKKSLKPDGRILVLEKLKEAKQDKSREEQTDAHTLGPKYVKQELKDAGFSIIEEITDFGAWQKNEEKQMWILVGIPKS